MHTTEPGSIPAYDYGAPTAADALASLARVVGAERAEELWARSCRAAGLDPSDDRLPPDSLERAAQHLLGQGGPVGLVGQALKIRLRTFSRLSALHSRPQPGRPEAAGG